MTDDNPTRRFPIVTLLLVVANVAVFFGWQVQVGMERSVALGALVPTELRPVSLPGVQHLFTSMFMHGGLFHLLGNMWFLCIFGDNVEDEIGRFRFVIFYLLSGIAAAVAYVAFNSQSKLPLVGASGAISGVLGAYLVLHPRARLNLLLRVRYFSMPAWCYLLVWIGLQVLAQAQASETSGTGIAHLAHIGGFLAGLILSVLIIPRRHPVDF